MEGKSPDDLISQANGGSLWGLGYLTGYAEYPHAKQLREWLGVLHPTLEERPYSTRELLTAGIDIANSPQGDRLFRFLVEGEL